MGAGAVGYDTTEISALAVEGATDAVYVGGGVNFASAVVGLYLGKWTGSAWAGVKGSNANLGPDGSVYALAMSGSTLVMGGDFSQFDFNYGGGIATYNGGTSGAPYGSVAVGTLGQASVRAIAINGSALYVGGFL